MTIWHLIGFLPAALLMALTPGPSNFLAFANGASAGLGRAAAGVLGRIGAYALLINGVAFGLGALLAASAHIVEILKWVGAAYLAWLAWAFWRAPVEDAADPEAAARAARRLRPIALARREFLTGIANPKALVLFTAFLPQFVVGTDAGAAGFAGQLLALGAAYLAMEMLGASLWAGAGAALGAGGMSRARRRAVNRGSALALALAAIWLAAESRGA